MHPRFAALCLMFGLTACSSNEGPQGESDRLPSTDAVAGSAAFDPSLDTPHELREDAGSDRVAAEEHPPHETDTQNGSGGETPAPAASTVHCMSLVLLADNGTFLGEASSKPFESNGVCNAYSSYGSAYGQYSIFNESGIYGNETSPTSAFNELAARPPHLFCEGTNALLNTVTKNELLPGAIDPEVLCATLARNGY
ncbi:MAG TPA: hypothetical protein VFG30_26055 [Polyangiales bacterium]|nr:hypothetical protein [Polyangiales bacterium]